MTSSILQNSYVVKRHSLAAINTQLNLPTFLRTVSGKSAVLASPSTCTEKVECLRRYQAPGRLQVRIPA